MRKAGCEIANGARHGARCDAEKRPGRQVGVGRARLRWERDGRRGRAGSGADPRGTRLSESRGPWTRFAQTEDLTADLPADLPADLAD